MPGPPFGKSLQSLAWGESWDTLKVCNYGVHSVNNTKTGIGGSDTPWCLLRLVLGGLYWFLDLLCASGKKTEMFAIGLGVV